MERRTRLLVHAGTSSSRQDDERYIAQAAAYLAIPSRRVTKTTILTPQETRITLQSAACANSSGIAEATEDSAPVSAIHSGGHNAEDADPRDQYSHRDGSVNQSRVPDSFEYIDDTQLAYTALESQLFTSSPTVARTDPVPQRISPWTRAESEPVSETSYMRTPTLNRPTTRSRCTPLRHSSNQSSSQDQQVRRVLFLRSTEVVPTSKVAVHHTEDERSADVTVTSDETTSELPASYALSELESNSRSNFSDRPELSERSNSDPGPIAVVSGQISQQPPDPFQSNTRAPCIESRRPCAHIDQLDFDGAPDDRLHVDAILERAHDSVPHVSTRIIQNATARAKPTTFQALAADHSESELLTVSVEIHAPKPKTSVQEFKTHGTEQLQTLHDTFAAVYKPVRVSRKISIHERGYWSIDCALWSAPRKLTFWRHLEVWVGNGSAGWGVWCTRVADQTLASSVNLELAGDSRNTQETFGHLRVYCWGEIVAHVYVLLYTASEGGVRKLGLQWIDSDGSVVVQMKGPGE